MRLAPIDGLAGQLLDFSSSRNDPAANDGTTSSPFPPGTYMDAAPTDGVDTTANVPNWGASRLLYVVNTSATAFAPGTLVQWDKNFAIAAAAVTANTGAPVAVVLTNFSAGNVTRQGGWVLTSGIAPVAYSVAATAGAAFLGTSGKLTPTAAAGKQVLNATCLLGDTASFTRSGVLVNGQTRVTLPRVNGLFVGQAVSGTGIAGGTTISAVDPSGRGITLSAAATAGGASTLTFTNTGFGIVQINNPFVQGQIT